MSIHQSSVKAIFFSVIFSIMSTWGAAITVPPDVAIKLAEAESKYGLPSGFLVTIAAIESRFSNSAINVDGVSFWFEDEKEAIDMLYNITRNPYLLRVKRLDGSEFKFFANSEATAQSRVEEFVRRGYQVIKQMDPKSKEMRDFRLLNTRSTDVCMLQINNHAHIRDNFKSINQIMDIDTCISYGAQYLARMIERHGPKNGVGCYHNCYIGRAHHNRYLSAFEQAYQAIYNRSPF